MLNALADDFTIKILIGERLALVLWDHYRKLVKLEKGAK